MYKEKDLFYVLTKWEKRPMFKGSHLNFLSDEKISNFLSKKVALGIYGYRRIKWNQQPEFKSRTRQFFFIVT